MNGRVSTQTLRSAANNAVYSIAEKGRHIMAYNTPLHRAARRGASPEALYKGLIRPAAIFVLLIHILAIMPAESHSHEIYYDGSDSSVLQVTPVWVWAYEDAWPNSLFPGSSPEEEASGNKVTVDYDPETGATRPDSVFGGLSESKNATDNTVIVINGEIAGLLRGGFTYDGNALRNTVIIRGGTFKNAIDGGYSYLRSAERNTVTISGGTFAENISGGRTNGGNAIYNTVNLLGGTVDGSVYGGQAASYGDAANNMVNIDGGVIIKDYAGHGDAYGGSTAGGNAESNFVNVTKGDIGGNVGGGYSSFGDVTGNTANISGGTVGGYVSGGRTEEGVVANNKVAISDGEIAGDVCGGHSGEGDAINNVAHVSGGATNGYIHGGRTFSGNVTDNIVTIGGGAASGFVYGGYTKKGRADGNEVIVRDAKIAGGVDGGYSYSGGVTGSTVDIGGGIITGFVRGGAAGAGDVTDNTVIVSGGDIGRNVAGGLTKKGNAVGNTVTVSGGKIAGDVYGGYSEFFSATGNTVTISGGEIAGDVYGGHADDGSATNNTVNINGAPVLAGTYIYGGYSNRGENAAKTGNTLNFKNSGTIKAAGVGNFEFYNFWLPAGTANEDKILLAADSVEVGGSRVEVLLNGESVLHGGDKIALITSAGTITGEISNGKSLSMLGTTVLYEFDIYAEDNVLWAKLPKPGSAAPESGALTGSHLASAALLAQAADIAAALEYMDVSRDKTDSSYATFAAVNAGSSAYDIGAGAEIDIDSFLLIAGVMWDVPIRKNNLLLRAFAEAGWSGYDTNGNYGGSLVRGSGDSSYYGAGLHARYQWTDDKKPGGLYADASLRAGRVEADFTTADMKNSMGTHARYDTSSAYRSAHVGIGHIWRLGGKTSIDISSKYLWTHLKGDSFTMATGDHVELGSVDSSRWRIG